MYKCNYINLQLLCLRKESSHCPTDMQCGYDSPYLALALQTEREWKNNACLKTCILIKYCVCSGPADGSQLYRNLSQAPFAIRSLRQEVFKACLWTLLLAAWCPLAASHTHHSQAPCPSCWHLHSSATAALLQNFCISLCASLSSYICFMSTLAALIIIRAVFSPSCRVTEKNHKTSQVGRGSEGSLSPAPGSTQDQTEIWPRV